MIPDATWQAGRMYLWSGQADKAEAYFTQVNAQDDKFYRSMVAYDKANALMSAGKNTEARQLVDQTLKVVTAPVDRGIQFMLLSQACYAIGDMSAAELAAQSCLDEAAKAENVNPMIGFDAVANTARDLLRWSRTWQKQPLVCSVEELAHSVASPTAKGRVWRTSFFVRSLKQVPLLVSSDDPRVKCTVQPVMNDPWFPNRENRFVEQTVKVEVPVESALSTVLHITSTQLRDAKCVVPLKVSS